MPSHRTTTSATSQPSIACGPPSADMSSGIVINGPIPIMFVMLSAVAWSSPKRRAIGGGGTIWDGMRFSLVDLGDSTPGPGSCLMGRRGGTPERERATTAHGDATAAQSLTVSAQQLGRGEQPGVVMRNRRSQCLLRAPVGRTVVFPFGG